MSFHNTSPEDKTRVHQGPAPGNGVILQDFAAPPVAPTALFHDPIEPPRGPTRAAVVGIALFVAAVVAAVLLFSFIMMDSMDADEDSAAPGSVAAGDLESADPVDAAAVAEDSDAATGEVAPNPLLINPEGADGPAVVEGLDQATTTIPATTTTLPEPATTVATAAPSSQATETSTETSSTDVPDTEPSTTTTVTTEPPETQAAVTQPPTTEASTTQATSTQPTTAEEPAAQPSAAEVPTTQPPIVETPTTQAPVTQAPTTPAPIVETSTTQAPVAPTTSGDDAALQQEVLQLTNVERVAGGCGPVTLDATLNSVADGHTEDMAANAYFSHTGLDGSAPFDRVQASGYPARGAGENIAQGQPNAASVVEGWMNSPGHRENILNCAWTELGVGYATGEISSTPNVPPVYWAQVFGVRQ